MNELRNGSMPQLTPRPTPVPPPSQGINGDTNLNATVEKSPVSKAVRWTGSEQEIIEIQKASMAIGLNGGVPLTNGYSGSKQADMTGVKFISLAAPLNNGVDQKTAMPLPLGENNSKSMVLQSKMPMRATLHRQKQIPGRFFPSPSYTEFQRDVLESRPTPRRIIKKFKLKNGTDNTQLFPAGSPVKPRTASDKSTWIANHVYSRGSQGVGNLERGPVLPPDIDANSNSARQYSIPATTLFHDGNNDTFITGSSKTLHIKVSF